MPYFFCLSLSVNAQVPEDYITIIDIQNLKNQSYLSHTGKINCDSTLGTIIEERICANLELQKQDSLLQADLSEKISLLLQSDDTTSIINIRWSQEIWERYRHSHCSTCIVEGNRFDMILFMKCAIILTMQRREAISIFCAGGF